ncbi:hypothetical protein EBR43_05980 [bacterium]|nr:hypothetical protein [bacterium]NBX72160.1 hypothetical protein [bacterium]
MNITERYHFSFKDSCGNYFLSPTQKLMSRTLFPLVENLVKFAYTNTDINVGLSQLDFWRQELTRMISHQPPSHPLMKHIYQMHTKYLLPLSSLFQFFDAIEWQINDQTLLSNQDFTQFCAKLSSFWIVIFYHKKTLTAEELFIIDQLRLYMIKVRLAQWIGLDYHAHSLIPKKWEEPTSCFMTIVNHLLESAREHQDNIECQLKKQVRLQFAHLVFFQEHLKLHQLLKENIHIIEKNFIKPSYRTQIEAIIKSSLISIRSTLNNSS